MKTIFFFLSILCLSSCVSKTGSNANMQDTKQPSQCDGSCCPRCPSNK